MSEPTMSEAAAQHWERIEPRTAPVSAAIVDHLGPLAPGTLVLDLGCGAGEPGLSVLAANPGTRLLGVDVADGMVQAARARAARHGVDGAQFEVMDMAALSLETASVDALTSRFGFLALDDTAAEAARVLRPGSPYAFAVWDRRERHPLLHAVADAIARQTAGDPFPPFSAFDALAAEEAHRGWLRAAGMDTVESSLVEWTVELPEAGSLAAALAEHPFGPVYQSLPSEARAAVIEEVAVRLAPHATGTGGYSVPLACRVYRGNR